MTEQEVSRYISLVDRQTFLIMHFGIDWKPEYSQELEQIDRELKELRPLVDAQHTRKEVIT